MACELYCCLLPQCEALRTCRSGFPIATKWCCDQDVKVVPASHKERAIGAVRCKKEGMLLQPLRWCCVKCVIHHERDVREEQHHTYMWREQATIEWSWHVNSIVACCHSAKLCACAARDFRLQHYISPPHNITFLPTATLQLSLFCLRWLINATADRIGYITDLCSMTELLHELKNSSF